MEGVHQIFPPQRVVAGQTGYRQDRVAAGDQQANEGGGTHAQKYDTHIMLGEQPGQQNLACKANGGATQSHADEIDRHKNCSPKGHCLGCLFRT